MDAQNQFLFNVLSKVDSLIFWKMEVVNVSNILLPTIFIVGIF